jgi:uncharacterized alpha-E superfamily protein
MMIDDTTRSGYNASTHNWEHPLRVGSAYRNYRRFYKLDEWVCTRCGATVAFDYEKPKTYNYSCDEFKMRRALG